FADRVVPRTWTGRVEGIVDGTLRGGKGFATSRTTYLAPELAMWDDAPDGPPAPGGRWPFRKGRCPTCDPSRPPTSTTRSRSACPASTAAPWRGGPWCPATNCWRRWAGEGWGWSTGPWIGATAPSWR